MIETVDPAMRGTMTITTTLTAVHEGLPAGLSTADNATGWEQVLNRLEKALASGVATHHPPDPRDRRRA